MKTLKIVAAAAILSTAAATAHAGGLGPAIDDTVVVIPDNTTPEPTGGSINSGFIVLGVLAALVAASASF